MIGFEPNDDGVNASQIVVESFAADVPRSCAAYGERLRAAILPGDTNRLASTLCGLINEHRADVCLLVGQAPGRSRVTFERLATNLRDFSVSDRAGNLEAGTVIVPSGPAAYFSTLNALQLARSLTTAGIPAAHIPLLPVQVESRWSDVPTMSLAMLREAVALTIGAVPERATAAPSDTEASER